MFGETKAVFELGCYGVADAARVTLSLEATEAIQEHMEKIETFLQQQVHERRMLGDVSVDVVKARYQNPLKLNEKYAAQLRVKMNLTGDKAVRLWSPDKTPREAPESWRKCLLKVALTVKGIYITGNMWGPCLEATDVMIEDVKEDKSCPF
jgi:hypothetical protein